MADKTVHNPRPGLWDALCGLQILLVTLSLTIKFWRWDFDDGFIVYRYAENIIAGKGWVYNPGELYNASTSALNTVLLAVIGFFGVSPAVAAHLLGGVALFLLGLSLYWLFLMYAPRWFATTMASVCVFMMANNFTWGLESNLFYGVLALYVALETYGVTSWLLIGTLILIRPDAVILLGMRLIISFSEGRIPWRGIIIVGLAVAPWAIFSLYSFGNVFPATLPQKMWQGRSGFWGSGWIFLKGLFGYIRGSAFTHLSGVYWAPVVLSLPLVLLPQGVFYCLLHRSKALLLFLFVSFGLAAYTILNVPNYHWYYVGLLLISYVFAGFGVLFVAERLPFRFPKGLDYVLVLLLLGLSGFGLSRVKTDFFDVRTDVYRQLSEKIVSQTPSDAHIAAVEVGVVGYYSKRPMIDLVGLTTPQGEFITGARNDVLFKKIQPEVIILHSPLMPHEQAIFSDPLFVENYRQQDIVAFPGYPELSFYVRASRTVSEEVSRMTRINQNQVTEVSPTVFRLNPDDPWLEYQLDGLGEFNLPVLELEYQLKGMHFSPDQTVAGRVYVRVGEAGYTEERAFPLLLRAGEVRRERYYLVAPGSTQNKPSKIQYVRFDPVQDSALAADTSIEIKSIVVRSLQ